jgi:exopolyphosphatase/guanosine-5'-triphosphate,3'-diphosphate pyrophosphatase
VRNANNGSALVRDIFEQTGIRVEIIPGAREAELICQGVRQAVPLGTEPHLIMDIGGGSVEFIVANQETIFWKQSFEIGAQRLLDRFFKHDPLTTDDVHELQQYLTAKLAALTAAVQHFRPTALVGASGSFDTLGDLQAARDSFYQSYHQLLHSTHEQRVAMPGMTPMRADMIVVACILIDFVLKTYDFLHIRASAYALKEGLLQEMLTP